MIEGSIGCGRRALYETGMDRNTVLWVACSMNDDGTKRRSCLATQLVSARGMSERAEHRQRPVVRSRRAGIGVRRELRVKVDLSVSVGRVEELTESNSSRSREAPRKFTGL